MGSVRTREVLYAIGMLLRPVDIHTLFYFVRQYFMRLDIPSKRSENCAGFPGLPSRLVP